MNIIVQITRSKTNDYAWSQFQTVNQTIITFQLLHIDPVILSTKKGYCLHNDGGVVFNYIRKMPIKHRQQQ